MEKADVNEASKFPVKAEIHMGNGQPQFDGCKRAASGMVPKGNFFCLTGAVTKMVRAKLCRISIGLEL